MASSAGTDFRIPPVGHWRELCSLSDVLAGELQAGEARTKAKLEPVKLPHVWNALRPLQAIGGGAGAEGSRGRWETAKPLQRTHRDVPSDGRWRQLRGRRPGMAVELDLIALLPPRIVAGLPDDVLRSLGVGGTAIAGLPTREERETVLLAGQTWDRDCDLVGDGEWGRAESTVQARADFYGPEELDDTAATAAVAKFLAMERRLHAPEAPKDRQRPDLKITTTIDPLHAELLRATKSGELSSFGTIRVKLLRVAAHRLAGRHDEARKELAETTADLVYSSGHAGAWLDLVDRVSEESAWLDPSRSDDPIDSALTMASWLLPQVLRLGHTRPTPYAVADGHRSVFVHGEGELRASVVTVLIDRLSKIDRFPLALAGILGVARCPLLWERLVKSHNHLQDWRMLARWGQAAFLRRPAGSSRVPGYASDAREAFIRLSSLSEGEHLPPRVGRWDAMTLDQQLVGLRHAIDPTPAVGTTSMRLTGPTRMALPVMKQGARADTEQRRRTAGTIGDVLELKYGKALKADARRGGAVAVVSSAGIVGWHDEAVVDGPAIVVGRKGNVGGVHWVDVACWPIDTAYYVDTDLPLRFVAEQLRRTEFTNTHAAVPGLSREGAYSRPFLSPSPELLESFQSLVDPFGAESSALTTQGGKLAQLRDLLLPKLVTGQIDVSALDLGALVEGAVA